MEKQTGRIEAFSDGVLGIAMTLLVIELHAPGADAVKANGLFPALAAAWPSYFAFVCSFFYILVMWINHHRLFNIITKVDNTLLILNGVLLFGICVVPFLTTLLADYLNEDQGRMAAFIYSVWFFLVALCYNLLWWYAYARGLFHQNADRTAIKTISAQYRFGPLAYLIIAFISLLSAVLALFLTLAMAVFFVLPNRTLSKVLATDQPVEET